ncbi:MAG: amidohydrolase family protein [Ferruginibacter sp.]
MAAYRKFNATKLFSGTEMFFNDKVLVCHPDGTIENIINLQDAGDDVEYFPGLICPGFINAHCHLDLSHLQNEIPEGTGLVDFVQQVMSKKNDKTAVEKLIAMEAAANELSGSGTVAVGDICNGEESIAIKINSPIAWKNFVEISGFVNATAAQRLEPGLETINSFKAKGLNAQLVPHSPYSVSKTLFKRINEETAGGIVTIHNQEAVAENGLYKNKTGGMLRLYENLGIDISGFEATGTTSIKSWLPYFTRQQSIISVHNSFSSEEDIQFAKNYAVANLRSIHFCICINANLYIENQLPPINMLMAQGCDLIIGTDSYASNHHLNVWQEIKNIQDHFSQIPLVTILKWATINGARALDMEDKLGSFERGKTPGIVHIYKDEVTRIL